MTPIPGPFELAMDSLVLLVDVQPAFLAVMHGDAEPVLARIEGLLRLARLADLPVFATLERPVGAKGALPERVEAAMPESARRFEKSTFDCMGEPAIRAALASSGWGTVALAGAETDVCVLQSVLGLLSAGYDVRLLEDCVFTSDVDPGAALRRMERAGAIPCTFKSFAYEVTATVDRARWPEAWRQRLAADPGLFPPPEDLPAVSGSSPSQPRRWDRA